RSASVPCGTSSSSISPARYLSVKARGSEDLGKEQIIFLTMPASIIAAMPMRPLPALLLITVRFFGPLSIRAWMSSMGAPEPPKPPIMMVAPSLISDTASATLETVLSMGASSFVVTRHNGRSGGQQATCAIFDICSHIAHLEEPLRETDFVGGFAKGLRVVEAFGEATPRLSIADVSRLTGLDRATARRCLLTLVQLGYADYDGKFFALTPRVLRLGHAYLSTTSLPQIVQPHLDRL